MIIRLKHILIVGWMIVLSLITYGLWWWYKLSPDTLSCVAAVVGILVCFATAVASIIGLVGFGVFTFDAIRGDRTILDSKVTTIRLAKPKNRNEVSPENRGE